MTELLSAMEEERSPWFRATTTHITNLTGERLSLLGEATVVAGYEGQTIKATTLVVKGDGPNLIIGT